MRTIEAIKTNKRASAITIIIIIIVYIYIALFWVLKALYIEEGISSSTTSVQHSSDDATAAILHQNAPPHISYRWRGDRVMKTIRAMMVRGQWANLASIQYYSIRLHPLLFLEGHPGLFNDHRESGPRFNVSSE